MKRLFHLGPGVSYRWGRRLAIVPEPMAGAGVRLPSDPLLQVSLGAANPAASSSFSDRVDHRTGLVLGFGRAMGNFASYRVTRRRSFARWNPRYNRLIAPNDSARVRSTFDRSNLSALSPFRLHVCAFPLCHFSVRGQRRARPMERTRRPGQVEDGSDAYRDPDNIDAGVSSGIMHSLAQP